MSDAAKQWGVLGFHKDGQLALPGFPEGFAEGLTLQAWVNPQRLGDRFQLIELGGGQERGGLSLCLGDSPGSLDLRMEDRQGRALVSATSVLAEGRWSHISATIDAQGLAALYVQGIPVASGLLRPLGGREWSSCFIGRGERERGLEGELSQLRIWRRVLDPQTIASQWRTPALQDESGLAACYPMGAVSEGQVLDVSSSQRHARVIGSVESRPGTALAETLADVPRAVRFSGTGGALQLPPFTPEALQSGVSVQAWIRPQRTAGAACLLELSSGKGKESLQLRSEAGSDALILEARTLYSGPIPKGGYPGGLVPLKTERICSVPGVLAPNRWTHASVVLDAKGNQCTVYVNGRVAHQGPLTTSFFASKQIRTHCYLGRSSDDASVTFAGALAEVRLWRKPLSPELVARTWFSRLRGDEPELLACYRLDGLEKGLAIDASTRRMHARAWDAVSAEPAEGLPLRSILRDGQAGVRVQGRLLTDWVPVSAFPTDRKLEEANPTLLRGMDSLGGDISPKQLQMANAAGYGGVQGSLVRCSVYEVVIEPLNAAGEPVTQGQAELSFDEKLEVVRTEDGNVWIESWPARALKKLAVPDTGRLRLRILAGSKLDCPPVRVHCDGMPVDAWVVARPADSSQEELLSLKGAEMRTPPDGRPAVFDKDTSAKDADAAAKLLRSAAQALPLTPRGGAMPKPLPKPGAGGSTDKSLLGDIGDIGESAWRGMEEGAGKVGDFVEHTVKHAADLAVDGYEEMKKLTEKAAKATLQVGADAARQCIRAAKKLAVDTGESFQSGGEAVWGVVQIIGTTVVDGTEKAFRVMVSGVSEALQALEEIARKVGAFVNKIIDFLAMLFQWDRFLKNMERIYKVGDDMLRQTKGHLGGLKDLGALIDKAVKASADSSLAKKTVGQVIGFEKVLSLPGMDELNFLVDQMQSAFSSLGISVEGHDATEKTAPSDVDQQGLKATREKSMNAMPSELFASLQSPLNVPMKVLMGLPEEVWSFSKPVCDPLLKWIDSEAQGALEDASSLLKKRLKVPVLTDLIEMVVLGGKTLNVLRLVALVGSIPMTLMSSSGGKSTKSLESGSQQKSTEKSQEDDTEESLRWLLFALSLVNAILIAARAVFERMKAGKKVDVAMRVLYGLSGSFALLGASADIYLASRLDSQQARDCGYAHGAFGLAQGVWLCVMTGIYSMEVVEVIDAVIEVVLGLAELGTTIGAVVIGVMDDEEVGEIGFRLSTWSLRALQKVFDGLDNYSGTNSVLTVMAGCSKVLSVACCGLMAAVDIGESAYSAQGYAS